MDTEKKAVVKKKGGKWLLMTSDGKRVLGTHDTAQDAYRQEYAIQKDEERRAKAGSWSGKLAAAALLEKLAGETVVPGVPTITDVADHPTAFIPSAARTSAATVAVPGIASPWAPGSNRGIMPRPVIDITNPAARRYVQTHRLPAQYRPQPPPQPSGWLGSIGSGYRSARDAVWNAGRDSAGHFVQNFRNLLHGDSGPLWDNTVRMVPRAQHTVPPHYPSWLTGQPVYRKALDWLWSGYKRLPHYGAAQGTNKQSSAAATVGSPDVYRRPKPPAPPAPKPGPVKGPYKVPKKRKPLEKLDAKNPLDAVDFYRRVLGKSWDRVRGKD